MDPPIEFQIECHLVKEPDEFLATAWLLKLTNGFGFNLTNPLASYFEDVPDFFQGVAVAITKSVSELDNFAFTITQCLKDFLNSTAKL